MPEVSRTQIEIWKRRFRRKFTENVEGLETLSDQIAAEAGEVVTFTSTSEDGESAGGVVTGNKLEMLAAVEELIFELDPPETPPPAYSRVIMPDYRMANPT